MEEEEKEEEEEEESECFQIVGVGSRSGRINQSQCTFPRFVIGLDLLLPLPTPTIWFSLDHKLHTSDYDSDSDSDSDSIASENQP